MGNIVFRYTLAAMITALLATLAHAVFVLPNEITVAGRIDAGELRTDVVQDGEETVAVEGTTGTAILNFSDLISGPDTGLGDGLGSGVIVTVWGQHLGSSQGTSVIEYCDSVSVCRAGHVYYWKNADGTLPSGPANLYESHGMQEIAFSIPDSAMGMGNIRVRVGTDQTTLPFAVRTGNIYHVSPSGNNSNPGSFSQPWQTAGRVGHTQSGGTTAPAGSTVYFHGVFSGGIDTISSNRGIYINNSAATAPDATTNFFLTPYPGTHSTASGQEGFSNYQIAGTAISKFKVESSNCTEAANGQPTGCILGAGTWGVQTDRWGRVIANHFTDQVGRCSSGTQGAIVGDAKWEDNVSNAKIFGNEVNEYGCFGSSALHHTTYMTIRSDPNNRQVVPWEFGWNYLHNNPVKSGIHQFDQNTGCGDLTGPLVIRNNVVINQAGPGIYVGGQCGWSMDAYIENNIIINTGLPSTWNGIDPNTSSQNEVGNIVIRDSGVPPTGGLLGTMYIRNNIMQGVGWQGMPAHGEGCLSLTGNGDSVSSVFTENICVNTRNYPYVGATNMSTQQLNNITGARNALYFSGTGTPPAIPSWATSTITADPLLSIIGSMVEVGSGSPITSQSTTSLPRDIYGNVRGSTSNIGAVQ